MKKITTNVHTKGFTDNVSNQNETFVIYTSIINISSFLQYLTYNPIAL